MLIFYFSFNFQERQSLTIRTFKMTTATSVFSVIVIPAKHWCLKPYQILRMVIDGCDWRSCKDRMVLQIWLSNSVWLFQIVIRRVIRHAFIISFQFLFFFLTYIIRMIWAWTLRHLKLWSLNTSKVRAFTKVVLTSFVVFSLHLLNFIFRAE